jgi:hypothetical protein
MMMSSTGHKILNFLVIGSVDENYACYLKVTPSGHSPKENALAPHGNSPIKAQHMAQSCWRLEFFNAPDQ